MTGKSREQKTEHQKRETQREKERESKKRQRPNCATIGSGFPFPKIRVCTQPISSFSRLYLNCPRAIVVFSFFFTFFSASYSCFRGEFCGSALTMVADSKSKSDISFAGTFASSAFAACFAEICTIPLDTAKVRLQLQKKAVAGDAVALPKYRGMLGTVGTIAREEGLTALWKGIVPGLHRQCLFGGLRIGLYEPVRDLYVGDNFVGDVPLSKKILAGLTTGALAITVANPTDLVKVRLQAEGKLPPGVPRRYSGALNAYSTIARQEGVGALWTGLGPNIARNAIINAAELASYDQVKQTILKIPGFTDNVFTHLLSGLGAGFFAVCIGSPVDVVKSRMMGDSAYKSTLDCFIKTLKNDGPLAFYKGFIPNFGRLGSWNVIMFLTLEQAKKFVKSIESS